MGKLVDGSPGPAALPYDPAASPAIMVLVTSDAAPDGWDVTAPSVVGPRVAALAGADEGPGLLVTRPALLAVDQAEPGIGAALSDADPGVLAVCRSDSAASSAARVVVGVDAALVACASSVLVDDGPADSSYARVGIVSRVCVRAEKPADRPDVLGVAAAPA